MPKFFFENTYFLYSIGWAVANSFWQAGILWLVYQVAVSTNKKLPALLKYKLSLLLLFLCFIWFAFTTIQTYKLLLQANTGFSSNWMPAFKILNKGLPFLAGVYLCMLVFYFSRFIKHYYQLRFVSSKNLLKAPADVRIFIANTALHLGIKKKVQVWLTKHIDVPSVTGFIKPIILLPFAVINNLSTSQINAVLLHELAHIKRNDFLLNFIQSLITLLLFFNPFVYWLSSIVKKERENCCDDWVLNFQYNQLEYAKALLVLEEQRIKQVILAISATNNKKLLLQRVKRLFVTQQPKTTINLSQKCQLIGWLIFILVGIFSLPTLVNNSFYQSKTYKTFNQQSPKFTAKINYKNVVSFQEYATTVIADENLQNIISKIIAAQPIPKVKKQIPIKNEEFILALVNKDAFVKTHQQQIPIATAVLRKEKDSLLSVFIKVEEEQSGKKQLNTYYFNLESIDGKIDIKPLLIIKKYKANSQKNYTKIVKGKKRITT